MRRTSLTLAVTIVASAALVGLPSVAQAAPASAPDVPVQLIAMNDFHGRISETTGGDATLTDASGATLTVGGSANIASTVAAVQQSFVAGGGTAAASAFVGAGDLVSASPFNSSVFRDEPTVEILNAMGLDVSSVGNHEFDRGTEELRRISAATDGEYSDDVDACDADLVVPGVDGCFEDSTGADFHGTDYPYLAANVLMAGTEDPMLPPYEILDVGGGQRMALIGVVTETTPGIVSPDGVSDVEFIDEAEAVNRWVPVLQAQGIQAIGVLIHEGGVNTGATATSPDGCSTLTGPIVDINSRISPAVDLIVSAHSHQAYNCLLADPAGQPRLVTQAGFYGRLVSDIRLVIDGATGDVDRLCGVYQATNVPVTRTNPDPTVAAIVGYWNARADAAGSEVVGSTTTALGRARTGTAENRGAESTLGNVVAEAQLAALQGDDQYDGAPGDYAGGEPAVAFMNPGGLRADIDAGPVTYAEAFAVQPFGNTVNATTLTGAEIRLVLEQQFATPTRATQLYLGTSENVAYSYDLARPAYDRVDPASITIDGIVVDPAATYRVVANSFLVGGGDSFTGVAQGEDPVTGPVDVDTAVAFLQDNDPYTAPAPDHGTAVTGSTWAAAPLTPPAGGGSGAGDNGGTASTTGVSGTLGVTATGASCPDLPVAPAATPAATPVANPGNGIAAGQLADTGTATGQLVALGVGLLLAGGAATAAGYRRGRGLPD